MQIAALLRDIRQPKRDSFYCVIKQLTQRALFVQDADDLCSNSVSHASSVHATRTILSDADAHVHYMFTGCATTFDLSSTVQYRRNCASVPAISPVLTPRVRNQYAKVHRESSKRVVFVATKCNE